ncbi:hypothetical protein AAF712_012195 [Marasmius tenuissimus]|uniref:Uncharacterized protein n=1 Tax=Marasmius tenuissimus TaxID=585030 RepID=A0ABR2ZIE6_9AGAR
MTKPAGRTKKLASKKQQTLKRQKTAKQATEKRKLTKQQQLTALNGRIRDILGNIRLVLNILEPLPPPHLHNQRQTSSMYIGATAGVTGPDHPRFGDLGHKYYTKCLPLIQHKIPRPVLFGNARLMALLRWHNILNGWVYQQVSGCDDHDLNMPNDNINNNNNIINNNNITLELTTELEDKDFEIIEFLEPYNVTVYIWLPDGAGVESFVTRALPASGYTLTLSSMKMELGDLSVDEGGVVEHSGKVWRKLSWSKCFIVKKGETLVLRFMGTKRVNNVMKLMRESKAGPSTKRVHIGNYVTTTQQRDGTTTTTHQEVQKTVRPLVPTWPTQDLNKTNEIATTKEKTDEIKKETKEEPVAVDSKSKKGSRVGKLISYPSYPKL